MPTLPDADRVQAAPNDAITTFDYPTVGAEDPAPGNEVPDGVSSHRVERAEAERQKGVAMFGAEAMAQPEASTASLTAAADRLVALTAHASNARRAGRRWFNELRMSSDYRGPQIILQSDEMPTPGVPDNQKALVQLPPKPFLGIYPDAGPEYADATAQDTIVLDFAGRATLSRRVERPQPALSAREKAQPPIVEVATKPLSATELDFYMAAVAQAVETDAEVRNAA